VPFQRWGDAINCHVQRKTPLGAKKLMTEQQYLEALALGASRHPSTKFVDQLPPNLMRMGGIAWVVLERLPKTSSDQFVTAESFPGPETRLPGESG